MTQIHQRLAALRLQAGLSQQALADAIGIERSYLSRMERGERGIDAEVAERWARRCGAELVVATPRHDAPMILTYERLSVLRHEAGLSQEQLAALIDVDRSNLSRMERGKRGIDIETAEKWVAACRARIAILTPAHDDLVRAIGNLSQDDLLMVRRLASLLPKLHPVRRADLLVQLDAWERSLPSSPGSALERTGG